MYGRSGMVVQLDTLATSIAIHNALLLWLHARCRGTAHWPFYQAAVTRYINTRGRDIVLLGVLMRDTRPNELDLKNRAETLVESASPPMSIELTAWYLPRAISTWVETINEAEAA
jgi:hypothetical protein